MQDLDVGVVREYRAYLSGRLTRSGRPIRPKTVAESHTALMTFLKWAKAEGYEVEPQVLELKRPRVPAQEPTGYHIAPLREVLKACDATRPEEQCASWSAPECASRSCAGWRWPVRTGSRI